MDSVLGVVFPLHKNVIDFMFSYNRDVFIKYVTHEPLKKTKPKIKEGMKLYIYESGGGKSIVGEATIKMCAYLDMNSILNAYRERLMISEENLKAYAKGREEKKALVLELNNLEKYGYPVKLSKPITMAGLYLTNSRREEYFI